MKIISKKALLIMLACFEASFVSCQNKITKIELINKNPIEYVFNTSIDSLYSVGSNQLKVDFTMILDSSHKSMAPDNIEKLFLQPGNNHDLYLFPIYYLGKSKIYIRENGDSIFYRASFYLHLEKKDEKRTQVIIKTIKPEIIVGKKLFPSLPHLIRGDRTIEVEPTTIEEYEILLEIGKLVGEKNMPPINLPEKNRAFFQ
jgi:hypothetical protein